MKLCKHCEAPLTNPKHPFCVDCFKIIIKKKNEKRLQQILSKCSIIEPVNAYLYNSPPKTKTT